MYSLANFLKHLTKYVVNKAVCVSGRPGSIQVMPQVVNSRKPMTGTYRKLVYGRAHVSI